MSNTDTITLGAGCFWCTEAVFRRINGVEQVISGYSGGNTENPTYQEICTGSTGHAEVCQIIYNYSIIQLDEILEIFWKTHDPTTLNRQGNDIGSQYRSVIFYHNENQKEKAEFYKAKLNREKVFENPVVTEISKFNLFYRAEDYHQNFYNNNFYHGYCQFIVKPKIDKLSKVFSNKYREKL